MRCTLALLVLTAATLATAGTWVASPVPVDASQGLMAAGGHCCGWSAMSGDHMLFFDARAGVWTESTQPGSHALVRVLGAGDLMLVVCDDLAVAYHGPTQTVHAQPLVGTLLDTGYDWPSFGCADELAAVVTDDVFHVFDARRQTWLTLDYAEPAGYATFRGVIAGADYVATDIAPSYPTPAINLAYSLRTGTFLETYAGINDIRAGHVLDHGFAGISGFWPDLAAKGWSAYTGQMTTGYTDTEGELECFHVDPTRWSSSHLMGFGRDVQVADQVRRFDQWLYDATGGSWSHDGYEYDPDAISPHSGPHMGGRIAAHAVRDDQNEYSLRLFDGRTHGFWSESPGLHGSSLGQVVGGTVGAFRGDTGGGDPVWWFCSLDHPSGTTLVSDEEVLDGPVAGDDWFAAGMRTPGEPTMDLHFYHGPTNHVTTVTAPSNLGDPYGRAYVYSAGVSDTESVVVFYSSLLDRVEQRTVADYAYWTRLVNDRLALYHAGDVNFLFDAMTGVVTSRDATFSSNSLGSDVVIGFDPGTDTAHGYSARLGSWSTQAIGASGHGAAGGLVGFVRTTTGSHYWGFDATTGGWTELATTGSLTSQDAGDRTIIVGSSDRAWAFWPDGVVGVEPDPEPGGANIAAALAEARCHPNPFNGRTVVELALPTATRVRVDVFDLRGRRVAALLDAVRPAGPVTVPWETGRAASGAYVVRVEAGGQATTRKVALVE